MKILIVTTDFPPQQGGVSEYIIGYCSELTQDEIFVLAPTTKVILNEKYNFTVLRKKLLSTWLIPGWLPLFWNTFWTLLKIHPDCIIIGQAVPAGISVRILSKLFHIPFIVNTHGMDIHVPFVLKNRAYKKIKKVLDASILITANSHYTASLLKNDYNILENKIECIFPATRINNEIIHNEYYKDEVREKYNIPHGKIIISVGRLVERKGFDVLIRAFSELLANSEDVFLIIVGDGPYKEFLEELVHKHALGKFVRILSTVNKSELRVLYSFAEVFCLLPRELKNGDVEGFGIVFLEAQTYGIPVLAGNSGGVSDAVEHGKTGLLVDPINHIEIAKQLYILLENTDLRNELKQNAQFKIAKDYNWPEQTKKMRQAILSRLK